MSSESVAKRKIDYALKLVGRWTKDFAGLVKREHTMVAIPFAYTGALLAGGLGNPVMKWVLITLAMVGARTAGMSLNRLIDYKYDRLNPRTAGQTLGMRRMRTSSALMIACLSVALVAFSAYHLNPLCVLLFPVAIFLLFIYSYARRFTWGSHLFLGVIQGCAPVGGWIGMRGTVDVSILLVGAAVVFLVAGFDIIYACQDYEFDRKTGVRSIPVLYGVNGALWLALVFHVITVVLFLTAGWMLDLHFIYYAGVCIAALLMVYQHSLVVVVKRKYDRLFFVLNMWISAVLFLFTLAEKIIAME